MSKQDIKDLSQEEKEELVEKVNEELKGESDESEGGNTEVFTMNDIDEKAGEGSAQEQYDKCLGANTTSLATLHNILNTKDKSYQISRKNLIKLIFATLKLPEEGATLKFGGGEQQKQACEFAYAQMQLAANCRAFILGVDAMRAQRKAMKAKEEEEKNKDAEDDKKDEAGDSE